MRPIDGEFAVSNGVLAGVAECATGKGQLYVGNDRQGHWVVRDAAGLWGGVFFDRVEALRFALSENGHRPDAVMMVPGVLELLPQASEAGDRARKAA